VCVLLTLLLRLSRFQGDLAATIAPDDAYDESVLDGDTEFSGLGRRLALQLVASYRKHYQAYFIGPLFRRGSLTESMRADPRSVCCTGKVGAVCGRRQLIAHARPFDAGPEKRALLSYALGTLLDTQPALRPIVQQARFVTFLVHRIKDLQAVLAVDGLSSRTDGGFSRESRTLYMMAHERDVSWPTTEGKESGAQQDTAKAEAERSGRGQRRGRALAHHPSRFDDTTFDLRFVPGAAGLRELNARLSSLRPARGGPESEMILMLTQLRVCLGDCPAAQAQAEEEGLTALALRIWPLALTLELDEPLKATKPAREGAAGEGTGTGGRADGRVMGDLGADEQVVPSGCCWMRRSWRRCSRSCAITRPTTRPPSAASC
jgi:hypothetical protein